MLRESSKGFFDRAENELLNSQKSYNTTVVFGKSVSKIVQVFVICGGVSYLWKCIVIYESVCTSRIVFGLC